MSPKIHYETPDGTNVIDRDEYHTDQEPLLIAYDQGDNTASVERRVSIPVSRIVRIDG